MRVFPQIHVPGMKRAVRRFNVWRRYLTIARSILVLELALESAALLLFLKAAEFSGLSLFGDIRVI
jgi:hypothetical protein